MPDPAQPKARVSEPGQDAAAPAASVADPAPAGLFIVECRLTKISQQQLAVLLAALRDAASRFSARGDGVRYLCSIFLARQNRLLSLFAADSLEILRHGRLGRRRNPHHRHIAGSSLPWLGSYRRRSHLVRSQPVGPARRRHPGSLRRGRLYPAVTQGTRRGQAQAVNQHGPLRNPR